MKTNSTYRQSGSTLAVVICIMAVLMVTVAIATDYTVNVNRNGQRSNLFQNALAIGDGAIEVMFNSWRTSCRTTTPTTTTLASSIPTPSPFPNLSSTKFVKRGTGYDPASDSDYDATYTISNYKVIAVNAEYGALPNKTSTPEPQLGELSSSITTVTPTTSATSNYIASADVTLSASFGSKVVARVRRVFEKQQLSPWNWAIFYVDPLEIHPGPLFTVTGWVHTNSDLYTAHSSLTFADKVTFGANWDIGFMPGDGDHPGETPASPNYPSNLPPEREQGLQPFGLDSTSIFNSSDTNQNNDSYHELIEPPSTGTDPLAGERYWDQAAIIIQVSDNPSSTTKGWDGVNGDDIVKLYTVNPSTGATTQVTNGPLYNMFAASGAITTNQTIQDVREGASVRVASLDVSKIVSGSATNPSYTQPGAKFSSNPIVYMYDTSSTTTSRRGIRVKGGASIPSVGFTLASDNAVYVQGDFNTGGTGTAVPSNSASYSDSTNPPNPQVANYTRAPVSILADAVNILSNNWNDANSTAGLGSRPASNTTVNAAIVSGIVATNTYGDNGYSGGAENFPRFLEDWSSSTFTYYGSMVELYQSKYATGEWGKANVYNPPTREWFFDNNFKLNPPPGTLMVFSYIKGRWYLQ